MCNNKDAERLIKEAKELEPKNPQKAKKNYLEAAEIMLFMSTQDKQEEQRYVHLANKLYAKAKTLPGPMPEGGHHASGKKVQDKSANLASVVPDAPNIQPQAFLQQNKISFKDIGGLEELKEQIRFKIIEPMKHPEIFEFYGKKMGGGILMYGPPGCGKTLIAQATANEANAKFFHVKSSDLKSKYVGETEKNIAELFDIARKNAPAVIFFDEFEALGADRTGSQHAHEISAVAQLLTEMDGMDSKDQKILILAATNEPWAIDQALRREGRIGETLFVPPPDEKAREEILKLEMKDRPIKDIDFKLLASQTANLSGADLKGLCEVATDIPLKEYFKTKNQREIMMEDFEKALKKTNSVTIPWLSKADKVVREKKLQESFTDLIEFVTKAATII